MRVAGRFVPQYQIAQPLLFDTSNWSDTTNFILCKIEEDDLPSEMAYNPNIVLKIKELQARYPDTIEKYIDEDGQEQERVIYGYFSTLGNSSISIESQPQLTVNDVMIIEES